MGIISYKNNVTIKLIDALKKSISKGLVEQFNELHTIRPNEFAEEREMLTTLVETDVNGKHSFRVYDNLIRNIGLEQGSFINIVYNNTAQRAITVNDRLKVASFTIYCYSQDAYVDDNYNNSIELQARVSSTAIYIAAVLEYLIDRQMQLNNYFEDSQTALGRIAVADQTELHIDPDDIGSNVQAVTTLSLNIEYNDDVILLEGTPIKSLDIKFNDYEIFMNKEMLNLITTTPENNTPDVGTIDLDLDDYPDSGVLYFNLYCGVILDSDPSDNKEYDMYQRIFVESLKGTEGELIRWGLHLTSGNFIACEIWYDKIAKKIHYKIERPANEAFINMLEIYIGDK